MQVRAAVAHKAGAPLSIETVELEGPKAGEVLVEIKATGVCHTDAYGFAVLRTLVSTNGTTWTPTGGTHRRPRAGD